MVPASRPLMTFADTAAPDYVTPRLIAAQPARAGRVRRGDARGVGREEPAARARRAARVRALRAAERQDAAVRRVGLAASRCCTSGRCAPASTRRRRSTWRRWTRSTQVRARASAARPPHRPAVRRPQRPDLAALHRGHAFLRRARLAQLPERRPPPLTPPPRVAAPHHLPHRLHRPARVRHHHPAAAVLRRALRRVGADGGPAVDLVLAGAVPVRAVLGPAVGPDRAAARDPDRPARLGHSSYAFFALATSLPMLFLARTPRRHCRRQHLRPRRRSSPTPRHPRRGRRAWG